MPDLHLSSDSREGYVLHAYGPERYLRYAAASVVTLRRHDETRPVALYATPEHFDTLERHGLSDLFQVREVLPEKHRSIVGFKHHLEAFMPFERCLFADADMVWCRNPDRLWTQLSAFGFTATGIERADVWFGAPKGPKIAVEWLLDRRRRTLNRLGLTHLPRVQSGIVFAQDAALTAEVCAQARGFLDRRAETHFQSRLSESGRALESCEWSLALAMSTLQLQVYPWLYGYESPQLDYIAGLTEHDPDFEQVQCLYHTDSRIYALRGAPSETLRTRLTAALSRLPGRGDYQLVTPYALHFGWLHQKEPFYDFADRTWARLTA